MSEPLSRPGVGVDTALADEVKTPRRFKVLMHNDHYTTMDFVVEVLMHVFNKNHAEATVIMLAVHEKGVGVCGVYPLELAETKVAQVHTLARKEGFPLRSSIEEV